MTYATWAQKTSAISEIEHLPALWRIAPLRALLEETTTSNAGNIENNLLSLSYGKIVRRDINSNDGLLPESFETYQIVEPSDIVLRLTDLQNDKRSLRVGYVSERGIITPAYLAVRPTANARSKYFYYVLHSYDLMKIFYGLGGGVRQSMKYSDLKWLPLPVPPPQDQVDIADFLDHETAKADALVAKYERLIELLEEKRTALIAQAVTKGLDPSVPMKDSGVEWIGSIPAHWDVVPFRYCADVSEGQVDPRNERYSDVILIAPNHVESNTSRLIAKETASEQAAISGKYVVRRGEIVYSKIRPALNKVIIAEMDCLCSADMYPIRPTRRIRAVFLLYWMLSAPFVSLATELSMRVAMPKINREMLAAVPVPLPPPEEQDGIVSYIGDRVAAIDKMKARVEVATYLVKEHRSALITAAVTGQIDVRTYRSQELRELEGAIV